MGHHSRAPVAQLAEAAVSNTVRCGFESHPGHSLWMCVVGSGDCDRGGVVAGWRVDRQLRQATERLRELRGELLYVNEQLEVVSDEAESEAIRAMVAETPESTFAANDTRKHADAMRKYRDRLVDQITDLERRQDELLDRRGR